MGWKIIEIETDEHVSLYLNNLMIKRLGEKILINISDIDTLLLKNSRTAITIRLLNALVKENVNIIVMDNYHEPNSYVIPINGNHNSLKVLEKQLKWTHTYKANTWKDIIKNKITNQAQLLLKIRKIDNTEYFDQLINNVKEYDITNREGFAAKVYWNKMFGLNFIRDQKSIKNPKINSMLNYGYAILRSLTIKSIIKKGLDTRISLFHKSFTNFFALSSDLMEPYRPLVDLIVYQNRHCERFNTDIKGLLIDLLESQVFLNGKREYINNALDKNVDGLSKGKGWIKLDLWD